MLLTYIFQKSIPPPEVAPWDLLLPTIFSVTVSFTFLGLAEKIREQKKSKHRLAIFLGVVVAILFTSAVMFLCFDMFPIPPVQHQDGSGCGQFFL